MTRTPGSSRRAGRWGWAYPSPSGMALGLRFKENPRARVFCLLGDGESNEGNVWEAAMAAAHYHLDNLIAIVDYNKVHGQGLCPRDDGHRAAGRQVARLRLGGAGGRRPRYRELLATLPPAPAGSCRAASQS